jgi:hypothetical protein
MLLNAHEALKKGYISRPGQMILEREAVLRQGDGRTLACHEVMLPNRLAATVLWDRCMDIERLSYMGLPLCYIGKSGEQEDVSGPFERRFSGGMLYTCGLLNVGPGDMGQPVHGRIHLQSAALRGVSLEKDALVLTGEMREAALFGENLVLKRRLVFPFDKSEVRVLDTIENQTPYPQPYMLLYHINLGYPMLSEHLKLFLPEGTQTQAADAHAHAHLGELAEFLPPDRDFEEQDFYHILPAPDGYCALRAENAAIGVGLRLRYRADTLPLLVEWRCLKSGDYVLGLEPSNNRVTGRAQALQENRLPALAPFESVSTEVILSFDPVENNK